jgi:putative ABC transport system permease protein
LGIEAHPVAVLANSESPISAEASDSLMAKGIWFERYAAPDPESLAWFITWVAGLFVLLATSIALGLSQIEAAADKRTLAALGAPKSFRARMVASQAFALTITGAFLGGGVGIAVGLTLVMSANVSDLELPITQVLYLLVGVPVLAALMFLVFTPRKLNFTSRQSLD